MLFLQSFYLLKFHYELSRSNVMHGSVNKVKRASESTIKKIAKRHWEIATTKHNKNATFE
jgi:hypothetical protein